MDALIEQWRTIGPFVGIGLLALAALAWRGCFHWEHFANAPQRTTLVIADLGFGMALLFMGMFVGSALIQLMNLPIAWDATQPVKSAMVPMLSQLTSQLPVLVFLIWRATESESGDGLREMGIRPRRFWREVAAGSLALLAAMPIVMGATAIGRAIGLLVGQDTPAIGHDMLEHLLTDSHPLANVLLLLSAVLLAPIFEEFIFRGLLQTFFVSLMGTGHRWLAIIATSMVFTLPHLQNAPWQVMGGLFCLSLMLGWLYEKHGSLLPCIVLHMLFNVANVALGWVSVNQQAAGQ